MISYDPRGMDWPQYNKLMVELFSPNLINFVPEENWRDWVDSLNGIGYFVQSCIPDHRGFLDWRDWAEAMVGIMNVQIQ